MNKTVEYQGRVFYQQDGQPYYRAWNSDLGRPDYLHRIIWEDHNGPIPAGFDVHHVDEDPENNAPYNLEALSREGHKLLHWESLTDEQKAAVRRNLTENAAPAAAKWHRSPEGRNWHREKATRELPNRVHLLDCEGCGRSVTRVGVVQKGRFCSNACKAAYRRSEGLDNEQRACAYCSAPFSVNRYAKTVTCSRACANRKRTAEKVAKSACCLKNVDRQAIGG